VFPAADVQMMGPPPPSGPAPGSAPGSPPDDSSAD
jgi:hypothetical protein